MSWVILHHNGEIAHDNGAWHGGVDRPLRFRSRKAVHDYLRRTAPGWRGNSRPVPSSWCIAYWHARFRFEWAPNVYPFIGMPSLMRVWEVKNVGLQMHGCRASEGSS